MQKLLLLLVIPLLVLTTTVVFAKAGEAENHGKSEVETPESTETCDPNANWKNHGEYVSCVARLHQGGSTVSAAARSDIGKKHASASGSISPSPTSTISATPTPEASESALESGALASQNGIIGQAHAILELLSNFLNRLSHIFSH